MPNPVLESIAASIPEMEDKIEQLKEALAVSVDAGEDRTAEKSELMMLEQKLANWKKALEAHGYKVS